MIKALVSYDFRHAALNHFSRLLSGPLLLLLIPLYLTPAEQGYWFTFISLAALAVFADMGFSTILLQFSAHEYAHLRFGQDKTLVGSGRHIVRIASLFRFAMKWAGLMALVVFPLVLVIGYWIMEGKSEDVEWTLAWGIYGAATVFVFLNSVALSFIEGCDSVGDIQKIRFRISVVVVIITITLLVFVGSLLALAIGLITGAVSGAWIIGYKYRNLISQIMRTAVEHEHSWFHEIMPLLWRYAISWASGYLIFSIFTPVAFHFYGAVAAGKVGLTVAVFTAIYTISNIWMTIIIPKINIYVAHQKYKKLNKIFAKFLAMAFVTYLIGVIALVSLLYLSEGSRFGLTDRLVGWNSMVMISVGWLLQIVVNGLAVYMRSYKKEPLVWVSLAMGSYVGVATILIANWLSVDYIFMGFVSSYLWVMPAVWLIYRKFVKEEVYAAE